MEKHDPEKSRRKTAAAGVIFSLSLLCVVVLLFLFTDVGESFGAKVGVFQTVYEPTAKPSSGSEQTGVEQAPAVNERTFGLAPEEFTAKLTELRTELTLVPIEEAARSIIYAVSCESDLHAKLELFLQNGIAEGFILSFDPPVMPDPLREDAEKLLVMAYEEKMKEFEAYAVWLADTFLGCIFALDPEENLSAASLYDEAENILNALKANSAYEDQVENVLISFQPYDGEYCRIIVRAAE